MEAKPLNYKSGRIRDPVHDYIQFTKLEHAILSHRVTQRLRYISQNGLTHLVYPEARGSRFSHALGSMHLSSQFLASSLHNADKDTEITIMEGLKANVRATLGGGVAASESRIKAISQSLDGDILLAHHFSSNYDDRPYILLAEQAPINS